MSNKDTVVTISVDHRASNNCQCCVISREPRAIRKFQHPESIKEGHSYNVVLYTRVNATMTSISRTFPSSICIFIFHLSSASYLVLQSSLHIRNGYIFTHSCRILHMLPVSLHVTFTMAVYMTAEFLQQRAELLGRPHGSHGSLWLFDHSVSNTYAYSHTQTHTSCFFKPA